MRAYSLGRLYLFSRLAAKRQAAYLQHQAGTVRAAVWADKNEWRKFSAP